MKDFNIVIKDAFGKDFAVNTEQIEEDVIRLRIGLEQQKQDCE